MYGVQKRGRDLYELQNVCADGRPSFKDLDYVLFRTYTVYRM
jgi:hypothetical protein